MFDSLTVFLEDYFGRDYFEFGPVVQEEMPLKGISYLRAPDKLLDPLGIYATWLSSIAYSQKRLHSFLTPCFFV